MMDRDQAIAVVQDLLPGKRKGSNAIPVQSVAEEIVDALGIIGGTEKILGFEHIPIERHWGISMQLHDALGHTEPWEICHAGCDELATDTIRTLFGTTNSPSLALPTFPETHAERRFSDRVFLWLGLAIGSLAESLAPLPWWGVIVLLGIIAIVILALTFLDIRRGIHE